MLCGQGNITSYYLVFFEGLDKTRKSSKGFILKRKNVCVCVCVCVYVCVCVCVCMRAAS